MTSEQMQDIMAEDQLVAEIHQLGITYLSNRVTELPEQIRPPARILADCIRQPSSRVRTAVIAVLLLHPEYAEALPAALMLLDGQQGRLLKLFYTAAVYLQRQVREDLRAVMEVDWSWLPDRFGGELGVLKDLSPEDALRQLGIRHQVLMHSMANWTGTYENAARHLIRYKQREAEWNQSQPKP